MDPLLWTLDSKLLSLKSVRLRAWYKDSFGRKVILARQFEWTVRFKIPKTFESAKNSESNLKKSQILWCSNDFDDRKTVGRYLVRRFKVRKKSETITEMRSPNTSVCSVNDSFGKVYSVSRCSHHRKSRQQTHISLQILVERFESKLKKFIGKCLSRKVKSATLLRTFAATGDVYCTHQALSAHLIEFAATR